MCRSGSVAGIKGESAPRILLALERDRKPIHTHRAPVPEVSMVLLREELVTQQPVGLVQSGLAGDHS